MAWLERDKQFAEILLPEAPRTPLYQRWVVFITVLSLGIAVEQLSYNVQMIWEKIQWNHPHSAVNVVFLKEWGVMVIILRMRGVNWISLMWRDYEYATKRVKSSILLLQYSMKAGVFFSLLSYNTHTYNIMG